MPAAPTDLLAIERSGVLHKAPVQEVIDLIDTPTVTVSSSPPPSPAVGDIWVEV